MEKTEILPLAELLLKAEIGRKSESCVTTHEFLKIRLKNGFCLVLTKIVQK